VVGAERRDARDDDREVDAILIGHAHGEHLWDARIIGEKTGALVVADQSAMRWIRGTGRVDDRKMATVKGLGGETFKFNGFSVDACSAITTSSPAVHAGSRGRGAVALKGGLSPEQQAHDRRLGGMVPTTPEERERIIKEGTIAYFFTFDNGFTMFYADSAGPTTDAERTIIKPGRRSMSG
jgi:L-ascorbate metabolism protein UlaG (beta-lactamase superfamily)